MAKILIIDDDDQMRSMLLQMLARAGHEVVEARNGMEGIALFRATPTELIITDLIMPEKEGIETIIELRKEFPEVRIIAISGGGKTGLLDFLPLAKRLGAARTLAKPFERHTLVEAVEEVLGMAPDSGT
jgi:DNA-binding NtrC family response regulator